MSAPISFVAKMAKRRSGRAIIVNGLEVFYQSAGYGGTACVDIGRGQKSGMPFGDVFLVEGLRYIGGHYNAGKCPIDDGD